jgi:glucose uptake protein GlcU
MLDINWLDVTLIVAAIPSLVIIFSISYSAKSLSNLFFGLAIFSLSVGIILTYFQQIDSVVAREWGDLIAITLVLCGLFVKTRNSKPIFARFPMPMTLLPLVGIFFYPMIIQADVVKDILSITYQGGAIIVGLLVISINHLMYKHRSLLLLACLIFALAFVGYWFVEIPNYEYTQVSAIILMAIGMLIGAIGFRKVSISKLSNKNTL